MSDFEINKGVGREVEFKGLRAQYLFIFAFGLLAPCSWCSSSCTRRASGNGRVSASGYRLPRQWSG